MIDHPGCAEKIIEPTPVAIEGSPRRDVAQEVEQNRPFHRPAARRWGWRSAIRLIGLRELRATERPANPKRQLGSVRRDARRLPRLGCRRSRLQKRFEVGSLDRKRFQVFLAEKCISVELEEWKAP